MSLRKFQKIMMIGGMALMSTLSANGSFAQENQIKLEQNQVIHHIKDLLIQQNKNHTISQNMVSMFHND